MTDLDPRYLADPRPERPRLVELASSILIIGSFMDGALAFEAMLESTTQDARLLATASVLISAGLIALGVMIRGGRGWLITLNVVAITAFLELQTLTPAGIFLALIDMVVVGILLRHRAWFQWTPGAPSDGPADA